MRRALAVTLGEPAGIGLDITLAAWLRRQELGIAPFYLIGDPDHVSRRARLLRAEVPVKIVTPAQAAGAFAAALPVLDCGVTVTCEPGTPDASSAPAALAAIHLAVEQVIAGEATAVMTNPIAKNVLYRFGFSEPGHTEYLAKLATKATGKPAQAVMMLWAPELAVVPVTIHLPLMEVIPALTTDLIVETGRIVAHDLATRFGMKRPRLAIAGLNPHAGEDGAMGSEDKEIVAPAVVRLKGEGIDARGPLPADSMFHAAARASYDAALCMYHDQALIPAKALGFDDSVNVTLGLPFVRPSPDHGTAFGIAGKGLAREQSLVAALKLAAQLGRSAESRR